MSDDSNMVRSLTVEVENLKMLCDVLAADAKDAKTRLVEANLEIERLRSELEAVRRGAP